MLEFKRIIENFRNEETNNTAIKDNNEEYQKAIAGEKQGNEQDGRSEIVVKSISTVLQKAIPVLAEPFLSTTKPIRIAGVRNITQKAFVERFANNFFKNDMKAVEFMEKLIGNYLKQDMIWAHVDWQALKVKEEFVENKAKVKILDSANVWYDSAAETQEELTFVAVRETVNKWALKAEVSGYANHDKKNLSNAMNKTNGNKDDREDEHEGTAARNKREDDITIIRYYGLDYDKTGVKQGFESAWVEGTERKLYTVERDFPLDRLPFFYQSFYRDSNSLTGKALIYFLLDNQRIQTGLMRGILDNLENANNEKIFFEGRKVHPEALIAYKQNKTFIPFSDVSKMKFKGYNALPQYVLNVRSEIEGDANNMLGTKDRQGVSGNGKFSDDKSNNQLSVSETVQVFSIRKIGSMISDIVKTAMIYSEWYLTDEQKQDHLPESGTVKMFDDMHKIKMQDQTATSTTKATRVRELNLLLQQSKENGKYINDMAKKEIVADLAENLDRPLIADMIRIADTSPSAEEEMTLKHQQDMQTGEKLKMQLEIEEIRGRIAANAQKSQSERDRIEEENKHKNALTESVHQDTKNKSLDATKKTMDMMDGLENQSSAGLEKKQTNK